MDININSDTKNQQMERHLMENFLSYPVSYSSFVSDKVHGFITYHIDRWHKVIILLNNFHHTKDVFTKKDANIYLLSEIEILELFIESNDSIPVAVIKLGHNAPVSVLPNKVPSSNPMILTVMFSDPRNSDTISSYGEL